MQRVQSWATSGSRYRISFVADLPPLGYRTYRVLPQAEPPPVEPLEATDTMMSNGRYRLSFDPESGAVTELVNLEHGFNLFLDAGAAHRAAELNQPPVSLISTYRPDGQRPQTDSFLRVEPENILVTALKLAEDNDDLILRALESNKTATAAAIHLPHWNRRIETHFAPTEIKTFRIPRDEKVPVLEVNLLEVASGSHPS
jgi:hypothetical protein